MQAEQQEAEKVSVAIAIAEREGGSDAAREQGDNADEGHNGFLIMDATDHRSDSCRGDAFGCR